MSTLTEENPVIVTKPTFAEGGDMDDLVHVACDCSPDLSLCGVNLLDEEEENFTEDEECVVCREMAPMPCPRCGETP